MVDKGNVIHDKRGFYNVTTEDGVRRYLWFNPSTGHWLDKKKDYQVGADGFVNSKRIIYTEFLER